MTHVTMNSTLRDILVKCRIFQKYGLSTTIIMYCVFRLCQINYYYTIPYKQYVKFTLVTLLN